MKSENSKLKSAIINNNAAEVASALGFTTQFEPTNEGPLAGENVLAFAHSPTTRILVSDAPRERQNKLVAAMHRHAPLDNTLWWFRGDEQRFVVAHTVDGKTRQNALVVSNPPKDGELQQLERLAVAEPLDGGQAREESVRDQWLRVTDTEPLTREFFKAFSGCLERMKEAMRFGPADPKQCHETALINLLRLVFLYFLQRRKALDGDREFVLRHWLNRPDDASFYASTLRPLYFGMLNTPVAERDGKTARFGAIPFLNGGLFEATPVEARHPDLDFPDEVLKHVIEDVFERYPFALHAGDTDTAVRAIDPEMLGKVFEGLMYGDKRASSGSFYTPRDVVDSMVEGSLTRQIGELAALEPARVTQFIDDDEVVMSVEERAKIRKVLSDFAVLDPACGTGAFLLSSAQFLVRLWSAVEGRAPDHVLMREVVHRHIFGVDIEHTAVRLCELRLWLEILARTPEMAVAQLPPLPNLGHRILCGNSLVEPLDLAQAAGIYDRQAAKKHVGNIARLQFEWLLAHGEDKGRIHSEILAERLNMQLKMVDDAIERAHWDLEMLERLEEDRDLFGQRMHDGQLAKDIVDAEMRINYLNSIRHELEDMGQSSVAFSYTTAFPDVEGFDVIVTNPPWVRANRLNAETRAVLQRSYECTSSTLWAGAPKRGIKAPFGAQVDLANVFLERSIQLLKHDGRLAALVPAKMLRSLQGTGIRRVLADTNLVRIEDFSESNQQLFDATTYPCALELTQSAPLGKTDVVVWEGDDAHRYKMPASMFANCQPWALLSPEERQLFDAMNLHGSDRPLDPQRGIFTGRNNVFIRPRSVWESMLGEDSPWVRDVLSGRDPNGDDGLQILWCYGDTGIPMPSVPDVIHQYLQVHSETLKARSDHRPNLPLWQLFRVRPDAAGPKVVWRDISTHLEPSIAPHGAVPLNTLYYIPCRTEGQARVMLAFLKSEPVRRFARAYGERARGGWRRHFAWLMRMLPVPKELWYWLEVEHVPTEAEILDAYGLGGARLDSAIT